MNLQLKAYSAPWRDCIEFLILSGDEIGSAISFKKREIGVSSDPTFSLDIQQAQSIMDDLWNCGLRPTEGTGSAGALAATQKHLEDMRTLVFKK